MNTIELTDFRTCEQALKEPHLKQSLYDEGAIVMDRVLVTLHGDEHRERRLLEKRVFRRDFFRHHEFEVIPDVYAKVLGQFADQGALDVVDLGYRVMLYLAIHFAGIDQQTQDESEFDDLVRMLRTFGHAATLGQAKGDREAAKAEIQATLDEFDQRFFQPSAARRQALLDALARGEIAEDELPMDVLTVLLQNQDGIDLARDMVLRETAFYFLAGAHTSVHSLGHAVHHLLQWCAAHPEQRVELEEDTTRLQHFVHESFRLHPSSPVSWRRALEPTAFLDGQQAEPEDKVVINLRQANRDPAIFGDDAAEFNPDRLVPNGIDRTGLTFGIGIHVCLGKNLAAGTLPRPGQVIADNKRQLGTIAWVAQALLKLGIEPDPQGQAQLDETIERETWQTYPVVFDLSRAQT